MLERYRGEIILLFVTISAAIGWFFSKYAIDALPSVGFIGLRFFLAALVFLPFAYVHLRRLSHQQVISAVLIGGVFAVFLGVWILAITNNTNFGEGAFLTSLSMLIAPLLAWIVFKQKPQSSFWLCLPIAVLGLYFLALGNNGFDLSSDNSLYLLTSLLAASYFVLNHHYARHIPVLPLTTIQLAMVGILCGLYSMFMETWPANVPNETWGWLAASVLIATNFRFLLQTLGQKYSSVGNAALIMLLEPVWTLFLSMLIFHEPLTPHKALGCGLIFIALIFYRLPKEKVKQFLRRKNAKK
ncbi:DMT family transporter [Avibacterium avium]|uniref:DMT family transporter n=1 Tax=Avibacterium avium TaxID=751 RepID=UPI003BF7B48D